ncbi:HU family DNA-binding protein [Rikenella microfusus]|uniref:TL29 n=1 Tax=Rikenella microfusus TaxID=28139 RepID=A0A379MQC3_9BACT|nr:HU family DNA-binding protein [Rikenella microfusus]SUE33037.1 TL29 [Rikenella microfusus]HJE88926.1 integration host factor subunit beta [Rikenella microfusus]
MTKADIVGEIAKSTGIEKVQVQQVVESFMENIKETMMAGNNVYLRGFGSFIIKRRAQKVARNISKNTTITIPAHNIPAFKPSKTFAGEVKAKSIEKK